MHRLTPLDTYVTRSDSLGVCEAACTGYPANTANTANTACHGFSYRSIQQNLTTRESNLVPILSMASSDGDPP